MIKSDTAIGAAAGLLTALAASIAVRRLTSHRHGFRGQVVLITGGARGLGFALADRFVREGARVVLVSRSAAELERARARLSQVPGDVLEFTCDIRRRGAVERLVETVVAECGRLDVLVNCAGIIQSAPFDHVTLGDFEDSLATHFWGPLFTIAAALPHLEASRGRVVNISSIGGRIAVPHLLPYCVGKFALAALSDGLHAELAARRVSVLTVTPGLMRTGSHRNVTVRGRHRAEARWFALGTATPLTAMAVGRAARQIVEACRSRRARLTVGVQARLGEIANVLAPELSARLAALASSAILPAPSGDEGGDRSRRSRDLNLGRIVRLFATKAAVQTNQTLAADEARRVNVGADA
jgi:NAD(P)-dependent dehydrogenase (short-subunit alcohol dehydrogenase family)